MNQPVGKREAREQKTRKGKVPTENNNAKTDQAKERGLNEEKKPTKKQLDGAKSSRGEGNNGRTLSFQREEGSEEGLLRKTKNLVPQLGRGLKKQRPEGPAPTKKNRDSNRESQLSRKKGGVTKKPRQTRQKAGDIMGAGI